MGGHALVDRLAQVFPQVEAVRDLHRAGYGGMGGLGVGAGPVPAHDLHAWVVAQPGGEGVGRAVGKDVDAAAGLHVQQDRGVDVAAFEGEVIRPQEAGNAGRRLVGQGVQDPDQGVRAGGGAERAGQAGSGASDQPERDGLQSLVVVGCGGG